MIVNCKNCNNPFGELKNTVLDLKANRTSAIEYSFKEASLRLKCRKCRMISTIKFEDKLVNEIDNFTTAKKLLE